jgi:hypothetical protein
VGVGTGGKLVMIEMNPHTGHDPFTDPEEERWPPTGLVTRRTNFPSSILK